MKVSFLVTFYNQDEFVEQALDSILAIKKTFDWEILVGDDGSTDHSVEKVKSYIERYPDNISLYVMPRDHSKKYNSVVRLGANKLNLLNHATGDFFCNLDGDDIFCDVNFCVEALEIFDRNPELSVVAYGYRHIIDGIYGEPIVLPIEGIIPRNKYFRSMYTPVGACVLKMHRCPERMDYLNKSGFFDDSIIIANNLFYGELYAVPRAIYGYRQTAGSIMTSMNNVDVYVHNTQGFDLDVKVVRPENKPDVLYKYAWAILGMYINKNSIKELIGQKRYEMYLAECREIENSLTYNILTYNQADRSVRRAVNKIVLPLAITNPKLIIKLIIDKIFKK